MNLEEISKTHIFKSSYTKLGDIDVNARNLIEVSLCGYEQMKTIYQYTDDPEIIHVEGTLPYSKEYIERLNICKKCANSFNKKLKEKLK